MKAKKEKSKEPEAKNKDGKINDGDNTEEMDKEKSQAKDDNGASKPDLSGVAEIKDEKKDNLLSADHKPDTLVDNEKTEQVTDKEKDDKSEKDRDRSPRKSPSKSHDRSRYVSISPALRNLEIIKII